MCEASPSLRRNLLEEAPGGSCESASELEDRGGTYRPSSLALLAPAPPLPLLAGLSWRTGGSPPKDRTPGSSASGGGDFAISARGHGTSPPQSLEVQDGAEDDGPPAAYPRVPSLESSPVALGPSSAGGAVEEVPGEWAQGVPLREDIREFRASSNTSRCPKGHTMLPDLRPTHFCNACAAEERKTIGSAFRCCRGCDYDICAACYRRPRCAEGHVLVLDPEPRHWCNRCRAGGRRTNGTQYRCCTNCDYDLCDACYDGIQAEGGAEVPACVEEFFLAAAAAASGGGGASSSGARGAAAGECEAGAQAEEVPEDRLAPRRNNVRSLGRRLASRPSRKRLRRGCCVMTFVLLGLAICYESWMVYDSFQTFKGPGLYVHYTFPPNEFSEDMEVDHIWHAIPTPDETRGNAIFASTQFFFENGVGGYFGTQVWREGQFDTLGSEVTGTREMTQAIFSCWDHEDAQAGWVGEHCGRFSGEGTGSHCRIYYPLREGRVYTVRMNFTRNTSDADLWTGYINDTETGEESTIGTLSLPTTSGHRGFGRLRVKAASFQEYFKSKECAGQARSSTGLIGPFFRRRSLAPSQAYADFTNPECTYNDLTDCIPGFGCGRPRVLMTGGQATKRTAVQMGSLWTPEAG